MDRERQWKSLLEFGAVEVLTDESRKSLLLALARDYPLFQSLSDGDELSCLNGILAASRPLAVGQLFSDVKRSQSHMWLCWEFQQSSFSSSFLINPSALAMLFAFMRLGGHDDYVAVDPRSGTVYLYDHEDQLTIAEL